jgi:dUTP pyrophosphatase
MSNSLGLTDEELACLDTVEEIPTWFKQVKIKLLDERFNQDIPKPAYATSGACGIDLRAMGLTYETWITPGSELLLGTGIALEIRNPDIGALIIPRSGLGRKGLVLGNSVGLIDSDYRGEILVSVWNRGSEAIRLEPGDRFAQLLFIPVIRPQFDIVTELGDTDRGHGGFGSTGMR